MTTEKTLTNEQIARVFAMYIGQWIKYKFRDDAGMQLTVEGFYNAFKYNSPKEWQLLLTPLSEITDEDAIEVAKMLLGYELEGIDISRSLSPTNKYISEEVNAKYCKKTLQLEFRKKNKWNRHVYLIIYLDGSGFATNNSQKLSNIFPVYQYLIQKGYAVPLFIEVGHPDNGKTAIELGIAIDKTKNI